MKKRELYLKKIRPFYESNYIKVITGVRRCGKSELLHQIVEELIHIGFIDGPGHEGFEPVRNCHQLKMPAADRKLRPIFATNATKENTLQMRFII